VEKQIVKNNIATIRKSKKISQKDLAKRVGISFWWMNNVERGRFNPSLTLIDRIAKELGVSKGDIFLD
jgi:DNA-binding XRE family transcriptional regulator